MSIISTEILKAVKLDQINQIKTLSADLVKSQSIMCHHEVDMFASEFPVLSLSQNWDLFRT